MYDSHNAVDEIEPHDILIDRHFDFIRHVHVNEMDGKHCGTGDYDFKPVFSTFQPAQLRWMDIARSLRFHSRRANGSLMIRSVPGIGNREPGSMRGKVRSHWRRRIYRVGVGPRHSRRRAESVWCSITC